MFYVIIYEHYMSISHIHIRLWYNITFINASFDIDFQTSQSSFVCIQLNGYTYDL